MLARKFGSIKRITAFFLVLFFIISVMISMPENTGYVCLSANNISGILSFNEDKPSELTDIVGDLLNKAEIDYQKHHWDEKDNSENGIWTQALNFQVHFDVYIGEKSEVKVICHDSKKEKSLGYTINEQISSVGIPSSCVSENGAYQKLNSNDNIVISGSVCKKDLNKMALSVSIGILKTSQKKGTISEKNLNDILIKLLYQTYEGKNETVIPQEPSSSPTEENSSVNEDVSEEDVSENVSEDNSEEAMLNSSSAESSEANLNSDSNETSLSEDDSTENKNKAKKLILTFVVTIFLFFFGFLMVLLLKKNKISSENNDKPIKEKKTSDKKGSDVTEESDKNPKRSSSNTLKGGVFKIFSKEEKRDSESVARDADGKFEFDVEETFPYNRVVSKAEKDDLVRKSESFSRANDSEKLYDLIGYLDKFHKELINGEIWLIPDGIEPPYDKEYFEINEKIRRAIIESKLFNVSEGAFGTTRYEGCVLYLVKIEFPIFSQSSSGVSFRRVREGIVQQYRYRSIETSGNTPIRSNCVLQRFDYNITEPQIFNNVVTNLNKSYSEAFESSGTKQYIRKDSLDGRQERMMFFDTLNIYFIKSEYETLFMADDDGQFFLNISDYKTCSQGEYIIPREDLEVIKCSNAFDIEGEYSNRAKITQGKIKVYQTFYSIIEKGKIKFLP